jgi:hypothetical protein
MSYQQYIFSLIARLGGSKDKAVVDPTLCRFMGDLQGGVFLAQLLYWSDKGRGGRLYKTYKEWQAEIFLSKYEVSKAAARCIKMGFLQTEVRKAEGNPTVHYTVDQEKFVELIIDFVRVEMESQNFDKPIESENFDFPKSKPERSFTETTYKKPSAKRKDAPPIQGRKRDYTQPPPDEPRRKYSVDK